MYYCLRYSSVLLQNITTYFSQCYIIDNHYFYSLKKILFIYWKSDLLLSSGTSNLSIHFNIIWSRGKIILYGLMRELCLTFIVFMGIHNIYYGLSLLYYMPISIKTSNISFSPQLYDSKYFFTSSRICWYTSIIFKHYFKNPFLIYIWYRENEILDVWPF